MAIRRRPKAIPRKNLRDLFERSPREGRGADCLLRNGRHSRDDAAPCCGQTLRGFSDDPGSLSFEAQDAACRRSAAVRFLLSISAVMRPRRKIMMRVLMPSISSTSEETMITPFPCSTNCSMKP